MKEITITELYLYGTTLLLRIIATWFIFSGLVHIFAGDERWFSRSALGLILIGLVLISDRIKQCSE